MLPQDFEDGIRALIQSACESVEMRDEERAFRCQDMEDWLDGLRKDGAFEGLFERWERGLPLSPEEQRQAEARGQRLLLEMLTPEQREEFERRKHFHIQIGERRFRLAPGRKAVEIDAHGRKVRYFCAHPQFVPPSDQVLTQKLLLENNPDEFFRTANVSVYHQPFGTNKRWDNALRKPLVAFVVEYHGKLREERRLETSRAFSENIRLALAEGMARYQEEKAMNRAAELAQRHGPNGIGMLPSECEEVGVPFPRGHIPDLVPDLSFEPVSDEAE